MGCQGPGACERSRYFLSETLDAARHHLEEKIPQGTHRQNIMNDPTIDGDYSVIFFPPNRPPRTAGLCLRTLTPTGCLLRVSTIVKMVDGFSPPMNVGRLYHPGQPCYRLPAQPAGIMELLKYYSLFRQVKRRGGGWSQ